MDPVVLTVIVIGFGVLINLLGVAQRVMRGPMDRGLLAHFDGDADVGVVERDGHVELRTSGPTLQAFVRRGADGKQPINHTTWDVDVPSLRLATFTTLTLSFEGYAGGYRNALGLLDIQVGDDAFDKRFTIRGSHADVVRAVLANASLQAMITRLFEDSMAVTRFSVGDDGLRVAVKMPRVDAAAVKALLVQVQAIAVLLDAGIPADAVVRDVKQLESVSGDVVAVSAGTGSPVVVKR